MALATDPAVEGGSYPVGRIDAIVSGPVSGSAIAYAVDGRQYIAVPVGGGTASPERRALSIHTELKPPKDSLALFVFALPQR